MSRRFATPQPRQPDVLILAAATWLASGCVLLGLTPLPPYAAGWGWSPLFWLVVAPALVLGAKYLCGAGRLPALDARRASHGQMRIVRSPRTARPTGAPMREHGQRRQPGARRTLRAG